MHRSHILDRSLLFATLVLSLLLALALSADAAVSVVEPERAGLQGMLPDGRELQAEPSVFNGPRP